MSFEYSKPYRPIALCLSKTDNILQPNIPRHIQTKKPFGKAPSLKPMLPPEITLTYCLLPERKSSKLHKIIKILSLSILFRRQIRIHLHTPRLIIYKVEISVIPMREVSVFNINIPVRLYGIAYITILR